MPFSWYSKEEVDEAIATAIANIEVGGGGPITSSQVTDFTEAAQDAVNELLEGASGVSLSYDDTGNKLTITGGGSAGLDAEAVLDAIGVALVGTGVISIVVNDEADTITISSTATQNSTDAALRDRASHTGTQAISTITGLQAALDDLRAQVNSTVRGIAWNGRSWPDIVSDSRFKLFSGGKVPPPDYDPLSNDVVWIEES